MQNVKYIYEYSADGEILCSSSGSFNTIPTPLKGNSIFMSKEKLDVNKVVVDIHSDNYEIGSLSVPIKNIDIEESEDCKRLKFKNERSIKVGSLTVEYEGMVFDADEDSQNRLLRCIVILQNDTELKVSRSHRDKVKAAMKM